MIRVWHLCSNRWNSAITEYALCSAKALAEKGFSVAFSALPESPAHLRALQMGLTTQPLPSFGVHQLPRVLKIAKATRADIAMTYGGPETFLSRFLQAPTIRFRGQDVNVERGIDHLKSALSNAHVKAMIAPGRAQADALAARWWRHRITTIPLGRDVRQFPPSPKPESERPEILILGRFDPIKGHARAMRIFRETLSAADWATKRPKLLIIGEPANLSQDDLARERVQADLDSEDVELVVGRIPDIGYRLGKAHLGLISSLGSEVICRAAEEFLLCGIPIVVSGVGSLEDMLFPNAGASYIGLNDQECGKLVASWLERSCRETTADRNARAAAAAKRFSLEAMGAELATLVSSVFAESRANSLGMMRLSHMILDSCLHASKLLEKTKVFQSFCR